MCSAGLDESQREAVSRALSSQLALIHGPPGTGGKTLHAPHPTPLTRLQSCQVTPRVDRQQANLMSGEVDAEVPFDGVAEGFDSQAPCTVNGVLMGLLQ